jgi:hypothetical protein
MLTREPTADMVREWQNIHREYSAKLMPNRKTGSELVEYLLSRYPATEEADPKLRQVVIGNVVHNEHDAKKLPEGAVPKAVVYTIPSTMTGAKATIPTTGPNVDNFHVVNMVVLPFAAGKTVKLTFSMTGTADQHVANALVVEP